MSNIIDSIQVSGVTYTIQGSGGGGNPTVELTQAEYDALVSAGTVSQNTYYIITDATAGDLTQYWTSAQTQSAITSATSGKVDTTAITSSVTSASTDAQIPTAKAVYNAVGSGGGGKAIEAGRGISITTGETADTINCTIPISGDNSNIFAGYAINNIYSNKNIVISTVTNYSYDLSKIDAKDSISIGQNTILSGNSTQSELSVAIGNSSKVYGVQSTALGVGCNASGNSTLAIGRYTTSKGNDSVAIGNQANVSGNSSVAIGRLAKVSGDSSVAIGSGATANGVDYKTNINNQLTIDTSNQVYISNSANTSTYCLQEKIENTEAALGGLSLVKLTQAEYDALVTKDNSTLYVIVN